MTESQDAGGQRPETETAETAETAVPVAEPEAASGEGGEPRLDPAELAMRAAEAAEEACREIARGMGLDVRVLSVPGDPVRIEIQGVDAGRVIGHHGVTLQALQYLVSRIVGHRVSRHVRVKVDVEGYRVRRENALRVVAQRAAERAVRERRMIELDPMPPDERRVVHLALAEDPGVHTESAGEGEDRRVQIIPNDGPPRGAAPDDEFEPGGAAGGPDEPGDGQG